MASTPPEREAPAAPEARAEEEMAELRRRYAGECRRVITAIVKTWGDGNSLTRRRLHAIELNAHKLTGAASIFGLHDVSLAANALTRRMRPLVLSGQLPDEPAIAELATLVTALAHTIPPRRIARRPKHASVT